MDFVELRGQLSDLKEALVADPSASVRSFVLFGSGAAGDYIPDRSDVNLAVVLRSGARPVLPKGWMARATAVARNRLLIWEPEGLDSLGLGYPIEMSELVEIHKVLHGDDVFSGLVVDSRNLRVAVAGQLARLSIELAQERHADSPGRTPERTLYDFVFALRGLLRLGGLKPARRKAESIEQFSQTYDVMLSTTKVFLRVRQGAMDPPGKHEVSGLYDLYSKEVTAVLALAQEIPR
ncbi:MAG: hypothetical protein HYY13_10280 [Nitrospirae bacterium]|nr:hypothetical protein [Nitrospirota bacterium]